MTLAADVQALVGANPTAAAVLDIVELAIAVYDKLSSPDLPAELANADALADAAEAAKWPPMANLMQTAVDLGAQCNAETAAVGCISAETAVKAIRNSVAMARAMMKGATHAP